MERRVYPAILLFVFSFRMWKWRLFTLSAGEPLPSPLQLGTFFLRPSLMCSPLGTRHSPLPLSCNEVVENVLFA
jgi:hypothetical protein